MDSKGRWLRRVEKSKVRLGDNCDLGQGYSSGTSEKCSRLGVCGGRMNRDRPYLEMPWI